VKEVVEPQSADLAEISELAEISAAVFFTTPCSIHLT